MSKYKLIENAPCSKDLFEGQSHTMIARQISKTISDNPDCKMIGIEGDWGSGKSNLLELVKSDTKESSNTVYEFFIYDAWGHQEDIQRRAILENLTNFIVDKNIVKDKVKWDKNKKNLLAKKKETHTKTTPKLSWGMVLGILTVILSPALKYLMDWFAENNHKLGAFLVSLVPFIVYIVILVILAKRKKSIEEAFHESLSFYHKDRKDSVTEEVISEDNPSSREFREWIRDISNSMKDSHSIVLVFDNMDRLPKDKVQNLWSSIHAFFSENEAYDNIRVIIPFDRKHIRAAFINENIDTNTKTKTRSDDSSYGDDFINKTFDVVFRVSPPTLSNWKQYFRARCKDVLGYDIGREVTQIYDLLESDRSPRKMIAFINELTTIKQISTEVPDRYIALYIFGKDRIGKNGISEFFSPSFLGAVDFMYKMDEGLSKNLAAIHYQLPVDDVADVVFTEKLKEALNNKDTETALKISDYAYFADILENSIASVDNVPNAIEVLDEILTGDSKAEIIKHSWHSIYNLAKNLSEENLKDYQLILLKNIANSKTYLTKIMNDLTRESENFSGVQYFKDIQKLLEVDNLDVFSCLPKKQLNEDDFVEFAKLAKDDLKKYKVHCDEGGLDDYLCKVDDLSELTCIPYIKKMNYPLGEFKEHIESQIAIHKNDEEQLGVLFARLKELEKPIDIKDLLADAEIYNLHYTYTEDDRDAFYYDLLCMRISRFDEFNSSYRNYFDNDLSSGDKSLINKISQEIESFTNYGDLLLKLPEMQSFAWYKDIVKDLTENRHGSSRADVFKVLKSYDTIITSLEDYVSSEDLMSRLDGWSDFARKNIDKNNISDIPVQFFKDCQYVENELTQHCLKVLSSRLKELTKEDWIEDMKTNGFNCKVINYVDLKITQNAFDALKDVIGEYVSDDVDDCGAVISRLLNKSEADGRGLTNLFKNTRDRFINDGTLMANDKFSVLGEYLFKYGKLEEKDDIMRTIIPRNISQANVEILIENSKKVKLIIESEGDNAGDFVDYLRETAKTDNKFSELANLLGIKIDDESE